MIKLPSTTPAARPRATALALVLLTAAASLAAQGAPPPDARAQDARAQDARAQDARAQDARAQDAGRRPFEAGERLTYRVSAGKLGRLGRGSMWISEGADVRGRETLVLHFGFQARVGPIKVVNETESWIDAARMASLRFHKHERHPLSDHDEEVELFPERREWRAADGSSGESPTDAPLDELSFIYFLRTLPLERDTTFTLDRHFDVARNPTVIRVAGREVVQTEAGTFPTIVVEMRVKDRRYRGEGVIRLNLSDDVRRLPVRIESSAPIVGKTVLTLESHVQGPTSFAAGRR
ncbi:MAG TPA: DUF3108 domain-containing protein [Gemmatimonadales bacterium]